MANNLFGKYYSNTFTTGSVTGGEDLISKIETAVGEPKIMVKKLTYIATGSYGVDINNSGVYSQLFQDSDGYWKLSLDANDVLINTFKIQETSASGIFLAVIY